MAPGSSVASFACGMPPHTPPSLLLSRAPVHRRHVSLRGRPADVQSRIPHAAAPCGRGGGGLLPCAGQAVRRGGRGGAPPTAQPPAMPTGWSSPTGGRTIGRRHGPRSTPAASRRSTHGQGTPDAKDLPPVFSGIFYVAIVVYRCCNRVLDMLQSVVFRM
jgi:hypothetical protein